MNEFEREPIPGNIGMTDGHWGDALRSHHKDFFLKEWPDWIVGEQDVCSAEGVAMHSELQESLLLGNLVARRMGVQPKDACLTALEMKTQTSWRYLTSVHDITSAMIRTTPLTEGNTPLHAKDPRASISPAKYTSIGLMIRGANNLADYLWWCQNAQRDWEVAPADDKDKYVLGEYLNAILYMVQTHLSPLVEVTEDFQLAVRK